MRFWDRKKEKEKKQFEDVIKDIGDELNKDVAKTITEIAQDLGMFPSDVEEAVIGLHKKGLVECRWLDGELYVLLGGDVNMSDIAAQLEREEDVSYIH